MVKLQQPSLSCPGLVFLQGHAIKHYCVQEQFLLVLSQTVLRAFLTSQISQHIKLLLTDPVQPGLFYKQLCHSVTDPWFMKISLRRRQAPTEMVLLVIKQTRLHFFFTFQILNLEGHQNCMSGPRVTAILLKK